MRDNRVTRRTALTLGAGTLAALAGCSGSTEPSETEAVADTEAPTGTEPDETPTAESTASYTVPMAPVGEVTFDEPPETWVANNGSWADMGVALGVEPPEGLWLTGRYHTQYYDEIDGVSVDKSDMVDLYQDGVNRERFYNLAADVHVIDPNFLLNRFSGWDEADVRQISENIGPFFGNSIFSRGYGWHDDYQFYTLYQAFEKLARVFQRTDRYEAFAAIHAEFQERVAEVVPPVEERPSVAIVWPSPVDKPESFSPYLIDDGTSFKQWRDLQVTDAFANSDVKDFHNNRGAIDYETLLEVDPDVVLLRGEEGKTATEFEETVVSFMESHNVASELTAVKNGDVYRGGPLYQGPITNLVLTERAAQQLYDVDEELFDRDRVAEIVAGNV